MKTQLKTVRTERVDSETIPTSKTSARNDDDLKIKSETFPASNIVKTEVAASNVKISVDSESFSTLRNNDVLSTLIQNSRKDVNEDGDLKLISETLPVFDRVKQEFGAFRNPKNFIPKKHFIPAKFSRSKHHDDIQVSEEEILTRPKNNQKIETSKSSKHHFLPPKIRDNTNIFHMGTNKDFNNNLAVKNSKNDIQTQNNVLRQKFIENRFGPIRRKKTLYDLTENAKPKKMKTDNPPKQGNLINSNRQQQSPFHKTGKTVDCWSKKNLSLRYSIQINFT